ncbi:Chitinase 2 [Tieghemiomyces parasiticus]|uniref:chitinase n=1 Tax=Tieghemiomyces parasiticus TaxID=78921 RepID=A0A9W8E0G2_9FUNG|nr:Chitinase 2 [Tieghemiomyces parasiticus]
MLRRSLTAAVCGLLALGAVPLTTALNTKCNSNLVSYWGQNSYKAKHNATTGEQTLDWYCSNSPSEDIIVVSFLNTYNPMILNLADHCFDFFNGTRLLNCPQVGQQIKACQAKGKTILLSLGGQEGSYSLSSGEEGAKVANAVWDTFLGGTQSGVLRPFGDAVLDGVDLDIEHTPATGYTEFVQRLRNLYVTDKSRNYYIAAAPLCHYPDLVMPQTYNQAWFDMLYIQFYNSPCGADRFGTQTFNFQLWDAWARLYSVNKDVKIYLGVPASNYSAISGYVPIDRLTTIIDQLVINYPSFGGVMLYDISESRPNGDYSAQVKKALSKNSKC